MLSRAPFDLHVSKSLKAPCPVVSSTASLSVKKPNCVLNSLPVEVLILIASYLSQESVLILSLVSRRLHSILSHNYTPLLADAAAKLKFLQLLEPDLPDYIICRPCIQMYRWKPRKPRFYRCPRSCTATTYLAHNIRTTKCIAHRSEITPTIIDLILRHHKYGSKYGVPASCLNHSCRYDRYEHPFHRIIDTCFEGHLVNGDVFLIGSHSSLAASTSLYGSWMSLAQSVCEHTRSRFLSDAMLNIATWCRQAQFDSGTLKCDICATDFRLKLSPQTKDGQILVQLKVWQNFGGRSSDRQDVAAVFKPDEHTRVERSMLARRDLEREFLATDSNLTTIKHVRASS